ncbi:MAG: chromate transporter [Betaproteobacteria bacterium]|jgi:chromate transporter|nr:chromate transporter [Betaproteobacteria bacterium]NBP45157.1 chromate transporter [Betaproteobacteria bacterium]
MSTADWLTLFVHMMALSLFTIGGAIAAIPDMHRLVVEQRHWLSGQEFANAITLAQAAPGPNVLFVAVLGWDMGVNSAGGLGMGSHAAWLGLMGALLCLFGLLLPSSVLNYTATRWAHRNRHRLGVRAFKAGMAPLVVGLLMSTAWLLSGEHHADVMSVVRAGITLGCAWVFWKTRVHLLLMMGAGVVIGVLGWV